MAGTIEITLESAGDIETLYDRVMQGWVITHCTPIQSGPLKMLRFRLQYSAGNLTLLSDSATVPNESEEQ